MKLWAGQGAKLGYIGECTIAIVLEHGDLGLASNDQIEIAVGIDIDGFDLNNAFEAIKSRTAIQHCERSRLSVGALGVSDDC